MNKRVLITGANGFIGYHLLTRCIIEGYKVVAATRASSDVGHLRGLPLRFVHPEYEDERMLKKMLLDERIDYIVHAAGITRAKNSNEYNRVNATYTRHLARASCESGVSKFVFLSSLAALGPIGYDDEHPITEDKRPSPVTAYGKSKLLAEQYIGEIPLPQQIILRPTAVYGPREKDLFILFKTLARRIEPYIGRGKQWLSFIHADDVASVVIQALHTDISGIYNLSDGGRYDKYELSASIKRELGSKALRIHFPMSIARIIAAALEQLYKNNDKAPTFNREKIAELTAQNWHCSIDRVRTQLGFEPKYNLYSGIVETVQWYKKNNWL
ncbi:MAG: NAD(P)-dependent oxidoreductase [Flavipsychrobacter sp.]|nr:NAD(P)-dependent oxidoreductase [Flavipsychrobacter sp.]